MHTTVSVITLHKGRPHHLLRLLEGLSRDGFAGDFVLAEMGLPTPLPALPFAVTQITVDGDRLPLAAARNAGRRAARGDRFVFLDVDCIPSRGCIHELAQVSQRHDALICAQVCYLKAQVADGWTEADLFTGSSAHLDRLFPASGVGPAAHPGLFWSLAFAVRSKTFDSLGGFDESFTGYGGEDTDFAFRASDSGVPVLMCADARAFHQPHDSFEPPLQHFVDIMRNATLFRRRHGTWPMQGWLDGFEAAGLITRIAGDDYRILRSPTSAEVSAARVS